MTRKYLVTEDEFLSVNVDSTSGEMTFTRDNGDVVSAGVVGSPLAEQYKNDAEAARDAAVAAQEAAQAVPVTNDGIMAAVAEDSDSSFARHLSSEIAQHTARSSTFIVAGDSITAQCDGPPLTYFRAPGYWTWAAMFSRAGLEMVRNAGVPGDRSDQLIARFAADVAAYESGWVLVYIGANDVTQDVPAATIIANLTQLYGMVEGLGRRVATATIMPTATASSDTRRGVLAAVNDWIRATSMSRGYPCADFYPTILDPVTGFPADGLTQDGTHPTAAGAIRMGRALAKALDSVIPAPVFPSTSQVAGNLLPNGAMIGGTAVADSWTFGGSGTYESWKERRPEHPGFEWQVVDVGPASTGKLTLFTTTVAETVDEGDQLQLLAEFETSGLTGAGLLNAKLNVLNADGSSGLLEAATSSPTGTNPGDAPASGVMVTPTVTAPAGASRVRVILEFDSFTSGTFRIGRVHVRKVA